MRKILRILGDQNVCLILSTLAALLAVFPLPAHAQHLGDVSLQTVSQTLFPSTPCTGSAQTAVVNNNGQTSHSLFLTITAGNPTQLSFFLEGSNDGVNFTRMSDEFDGNLAGQLQASGYFTVVRANVTCAPAVTTSFVLSYSGSGVPQNQPAGDGLRAQIEKVLINGVTATTGQSGTLRAPYGNLSGLLLVGTSGSFTGTASISITCTYLSASGTPQSFTLSGSQARLAVTPTPCSVVSWNYVPGTSTGTLGVEYVFSAGFSGATGSPGLIANVQGVVGNNTALAGVFPVLVGGMSSQNNALLTIPGVDTGLNPVQGWAIGLGGSTAGGSAVTFPNGNSPLAIAVEGQSSNGSGSDLAVQATQGSCLQPLGNCNGLFTASSGYGKQATVTALTTNLNANLWGATSTGITDRGVLQECWFSVQVTAASGTTPTLNVFLQDGPDGTNFDDRAALPQFTTTGAAAGGISGGGVGLTPAVFQSGALAAGTKVDGPIGPFGNLRFVVGGTTPSFSFVYTVACR